MKAFEIQQFGIENLALVERDAPEPQANQVLIKFHAASLNFRDLMMVKGFYNPRAKLPAIPFSDGAGEIVAVGENISKWKIGDRVCPIFIQNWIEGEPTAAKGKTSLGGGDRDGVLREFGAFDEESVVRIPELFSYEEAATLPCTGVTAWHALVASGKLKAGESVLTLGTGGVSIYAVQIAKMFGAQIFATSSSDEKIEKLRALGASETINYKNTPDWDKEVLRLTEKRGVDHVVEVGGAGTLAKSINSVRVGGHVAVIGALSGAGEVVSPIPILMRSIRLQGVFVGSRKMFEDLNRAVETNGIKPVIDRTFAFEETPDALRYMESGAHFGKIVIRF